MFLIKLLIVLCGSVAFLDCILFGHLLPILGLAVPLGAFFVIKMRCSINPNLFVPLLCGNRRSSRRVASRKLWERHWRRRAYGHWHRRGAWGFFRLFLRGGSGRTPTR